LHDRGPVPTDAFFGIGQLTAIIEFDGSLEPVGPVDEGNWTCSDAGGPRIVNAALIQGIPGVVQLQLQAPTGGPGPGLCSFAPPPFDLKDALLEPVQPFVDFVIRPQA